MKSSVRVVAEIVLTLLLVPVASLPAQSPAPQQPSRETAAEAKQLLQQGIAAKEKKDYAQALELLTRSLSLVKSAAALCERGVVHIGLKENEAALLDLNHALLIDPRMSEALQKRGWCHMMMNDRNHALADLTTAIELDPNCTDAYLYRGVLWFNLKEYQLAYPDLKIAERALPDHTFLQMALAVSCECLDQREAAARHWDRAFQLEPQNVTNRVARGKVREKQAEFAGALADFEAALTMEPENLHALNSLSGFLSTCPVESFRDYARALSLAEKCCERTEWKDALLIAMLATAHAQAGNFETAMKWQQEALRLATEEHRRDFELRLEMYRRGEAPYPLQTQQAAAELERK